MHNKWPCDNKPPQANTCYPHKTGTQIPLEPRGQNHRNGWSKEISESQRAATAKLKKCINAECGRQLVLQLARKDALVDDSNNSNCNNGDNTCCSGQRVLLRARPLRMTRRRRRRRRLGERSFGGRQSCWPFPCWPGLHWPLIWCWLLLGALSDDWPLI